MLLAPMKHMPIRCPRQAWSLYFNYKGFHSLVLMGLVDTDYKFIWFDIAACGSSSDSQIFLYNDLRQKIEDNTLAFPLKESLVDHGPQVQYFFVGDEPPNQDDETLLPQKSGH